MKKTNEIVKRIKEGNMTIIEKLKSIPYVLKSGLKFIGLTTILLFPVVLFINFIISLFSDIGFSFFYSFKFSVLCSISFSSIFVLLVIILIFSKK